MSKVFFFLGGGGGTRAFQPWILGKDRHVLEVGKQALV